MVNTQKFMAVILAGGKGTRLKPLTMTIPKPLLPLGDIPILEIVLRQLVASGAYRIVLSLGHMASLFKAVIDNSQWGVNVEYCFEDEPLGTAGSLRNVPNLDDNFLVMNGDLLTTIDYQTLFKKHISQNAWGTIALHSRIVNIDYGVIDTTEDGFLNTYTEKPTLTYNVSMGVNVLTKKCLEFIPERQKFDMPQLMMAMATAGKPVLCYKTDCYWQDIGRFDDYQQASSDFVSDRNLFLP